MQGASRGKTPFVGNTLIVKNCSTLTQANKASPGLDHLRGLTRFTAGGDVGLSRMRIGQARVGLDRG